MTDPTWTLQETIDALASERDVETQLESEALAWLRKLKGQVEAGQRERESLVRKDGEDLSLVRVALETAKNRIVELQLETHHYDTTLRENAEQRIEIAKLKDQRKRLREALLEEVHPTGRWTTLLAETES